MRLVLALYLAHAGVERVQQPPLESRFVALAALWLVGSLLIAIGAMTPLTLVAIATSILLDAARSPFETHLSALWARGFALVTAASLVLLGPGAHSIDGRMFGRREINIRRHSGGDAAHGNRPSVVRQSHLKE